MRLLAPIVRLLRRTQEWHESRIARHALRKEQQREADIRDHGSLSDESYSYWMNRIAMEEANGTRKRDYEA